MTKNYNTLNEEGMLSLIYYMIEAPNSDYKWRKCRGILMSLPPIAKWK